MDRLLTNPGLPFIDVRTMVELADEFEYPIDVKDVRTGKYIRNNLAAASVSGLSPEERLGMDVHDIAKINRITSAAVAKVVEADQKVAATSLPGSFNHIFLNRDGSLLVDKVFKKPILGSHGDPVAILTYAHTVTDYIDVAQLFKLYKIYYPQKSAVQQFLKHLNLEKEFIELPTERELRALLIMQSHVSASKYVARLMHLSSRTIEEYKSRIRYKLRTLTFEKLLSMLRHYGHYESIVN
jgi:DNA-binding CsgD family transcriptional regulator